MSFSVKENLRQIQERIADAATGCGRRPEDVKLVAVTKTIAVPRIQEAIRAGATICGENYIQDARGKIDEIGRTVQWHFIGHLQTNKAKYAIELFDLIHSVDNISLARELNKRAEKKNILVDVLIQVNISEESTKYGASRQGLFDLLREMEQLTSIRIKGLMTMPPYFPDPEQVRPYFQTLRRLRDEVAALDLPHVSMEELSMGMSNDFEVAIQETATMVRVGTAIFGPR